MSLTKVSFSMINGAVVNVVDYGADPTGVSNSAPAIQAAIDAVQANNGGEVVLPAGNFLLGTALNLTNLDWPMTISGAGKGTTIRSSGITTVCIDGTGSSDLVFRDFQMATTSGVPQAAILLARSTTLECLRNILSNVIIDGAYSKAAFYSFAAEELTLQNCDFRSVSNGATAYADTSDNLGAGEGIASVYATIYPATDQISNSVKRITNCTFRVEGSGNTDCIRIRGGLQFFINDTFFVPSVTATGPTRSVVYIDGTTVGASTPNLDNWSLTNFRSEGGRKAVSGIYNVSSTLGTGFVYNGQFDVTGNLLYSPGAEVSYLFWRNVIGPTSTTVSVGFLYGVDMNVNIITVTGTVTLSRLECNSASTFGGTLLTNNFIYNDSGTDYIERSKVRRFQYVSDGLADSATPSVANATLFQPLGATTITNLLDGVNNQVVTIIANGPTTITSGTNIFLNGNVNFAMVLRDTLTLVLNNEAPPKWIELARSVNH